MFPRLPSIIPAIVAVSFAHGAEALKIETVSIFNGKDLTGWTGEGYVVEDGAIVCTPQGRNLMTQRTFANYVFEFEFKLPPGGNNGIGIHYPGEGDPAYTGMEIQVLDDTDPKYKDLEPYQFHGSIYTMVPSEKGHLKPVGEWNKERIIVNGEEIRVELNGHVITRARLNELNQKFPDHKGAQRRSGHIALCGHGDRVAFRNLSVAEIAPTANVDAVKAAGFTPLFDGATLAGWQADNDHKGSWFPHNGILKYNGKSKDLWTEKEYGDFTLVFDWRWAAPGPLMKRPLIGPDGKETGESVEVQELDSGVYLRGSSKSQVNLWNWPVGSGEVYGYRTDGSQPAEVRAGVTPKTRADKPVGEWNRTMITMKGELLTVVINGKTVIENAKLPGVAAKGRLALQHHGASIDFANLWIKEL